MTGPGDALERIVAAIDWDTHAAGPRAAWPQTFRTAFGICANAKIPMVVYWGPAFLQFYNDAAARIYGARHPGALGQPARSSWPELWASIGTLLNGVKADGLPALIERWQTRVGTADAYFSIAFCPIHDGADVAGVLAIVTETTAEVAREREARERAGEREFLSRAGRLLAESLDLPTTLHNIARLTVPQFADWCQIDLRTSDGRIKTVAVAHSDPRRDRMAQQLVGRVHLDPDYERGNAYVIRTGCSDLVEDVAPSTLAAAVADDSEFSLYEQFGTRSFVSIPLVAQGTTLGALGVVYGDSGRRYSPGSLPVLEELGRRAGLAVQNAREFGREHRVAQSFQEASLPSVLPNVPGLRFDAVYVPASDEARIGGDWYDAVRLLDGRIVISIGDVAGKGLDAAVTMGNMRQIIRGIAQVHADPALMLDAADRALRLEHPDRFVTAFVGVFDPVAKTFAYASAGHPPLLLRFRDGRIEALSDGGLPLGLREGRDASGGSIIDAALAEALVLYTDGLTEHFRDPIAGEWRLRELVADPGCYPAIVRRRRSKWHFSQAGRRPTTSPFWSSGLKRALGRARRRRRCSIGRSTSKIPDRSRRRGARSAKPCGCAVRRSRMFCSGDGVRRISGQHRPLRADLVEVTVDWSVVAGPACSGSRARLSAYACFTRRSLQRIGPWSVLGLDAHAGFPCFENGQTAAATPARCSHSDVSGLHTPRRRRHRRFEWKR